MRTCIYFIGPENGPIKIGKAKNVKHRLSGIQVGYPHKLFIHGVMLASPRAETALHAKFSSARLNGEWFERTPEILAYIDKNTFPEESMLWKKLDPDRVIIKKQKPTKEAMNKIRIQAKLEAEEKIFKSMRSWFGSHMSSLITLVNKIDDIRHKLEWGTTVFHGEIDDIRLRARRVIDVAAMCRWQDSTHFLGDSEYFMNKSDALETLKKIPTRYGGFNFPEHLENILNFVKKEDHTA